MLYLVETVFFAGLFLSGGYGLAALLLARVICSALYNLLFTLCTAGFPPEVRSTGGGMLPNVGRLGSMCAPLLGYLDTKMVVWISIISSCLGFIVCVGFNKNEHLHNVSNMIQEEHKKKKHFSRVVVHLPWS